MAEVVVVVALVCTGLYAGYMVAFQSGVMPGFELLDDGQFAAAMRATNRTVPRALFLVLFVGSVVAPVVSLVWRPEGRDGAGQLLFAVAAGCALVGHLITVVGNIPLNNALDAARGQGDESAARTAFESRWNRLHAVRTVFATAAFAALVVAVV